MDTAKFLRAIIFVALLIGFVAQVRQSLIKFFGRKTTVAIGLRQTPRLALPAVSFCPGFKRHIARANRKRESDHYPSSYFDVHPNQSKCDI